jgi:hypothetical protein
MAIYTRHPLWGPGTAQRLPRPDQTLRIRIRPGVLSGLYAAVSRDVSKGAPQAPRVETRPANETDFTPDGVAEPGTEVPMPQWHRGVTN